MEIHENMSDAEIFDAHVRASKFFVSRLFLQGPEAEEVIKTYYRDQNLAAEMLLDVASYVDDAACEVLSKPLFPRDRVIGGEAINPFGVMLAVVNLWYGYVGVVELWSGRKMAIRAFPDYARIKGGGNV